MKVKPFCALRPLPGHEAEVADVPYDVTDTAEARQRVENRPWSILRITRPEVNFERSAPLYSDEEYKTAADLFQRLSTEGPVVRDTVPSFSVYRQQWGEHVQCGIVACIHRNEYLEQRIRVHERTRQDKEDDRTRHIVELRAATGPVFLMHRGSEGIREICASAMAEAPVSDLTADDGVRHTVWRVDAVDAVRQVLAALSHCYVADGHHRAKAAVRSAEAFRGEFPDEEAAPNWIMAVLFSAEELKILPYHRLVSGLNGLSAERFIEEVANRMPLSVSEESAPLRRGEAGMYVAGQWYRLKFKSEPSVAAADKLDVAVLQQQLLAPLLGINDPREDERIQFVGGIHGTGRLRQMVDGGQADVAFCMHPVSVNEVMDIADAGGIMPPKSTWFEPKLRSGLFVYSF